MLTKISESEIHSYLETEVHMNCDDYSVLYLDYMLSSLCNNDALLNDRRVMPLYSLAAEHFHTTLFSVEHSVRRLLAKNGQKMSNGAFMFRTAEAIAANHLSKMDVQ